MDRKIKALRRVSKNIKPTIIIGKNGINDNNIKIIKEQLTKNDIVKVKILKSYIEDKDKMDVFSAITAKTGARIIHTLGFTISLTRR